MFDGEVGQESLILPTQVGRASRVIGGDVQHTEEAHNEAGHAAIIHEIL